MNGRSPDGSGSRATHEAASASSPEASIPNAKDHVKLNMLVLEAAQAQDAFDQWDGGSTFDWLGIRRRVDLETVTREWDEANSRLIAFVRETTPRCETCKHWRFDEPDWQFDDLRIGECKAIRMRETIESEACEGTPFNRHDVDEAGGLIKEALTKARAIAVDGSGYYAALRTFKDFGCVLHEPKTSPVEEDRA